MGTNLEIKQNDNIIEKLRIKTQSEFKGEIIKITKVSDDIYSVE
jgi:hypothetical protein